MSNRWGDDSSGSSVSTTGDDPFLAEPADIQEPPAPAFSADLMAFFGDIGTFLMDADFFAEIDDMVEVIDDHDIGVAGMGFDTTDLLDVLGAMFGDELDLNPEFTYPEHPRGSIRPASRSSQRTRDVLKDCVHIPSPRYLVASNGGLFVYHDDDNVIQVGRAAEDQDWMVPIIDERAFAAAESLNENTMAKNTGLGFSSFVHLIGQMIICHSFPGSVYEPDSGRDVLASVGSFEIKGHGWETANVPCDYMVSKYRLVVACLPPSDELSHIIKLAESEDLGCTDGFVGSAFDQGDSPYRSVCDRLHQLTDDVTFVQREDLLTCFKSWLSRQARLVPPPREDIEMPVLIWNALLKGSKKDKLNADMFPAPLRVIAPDENVDTEYWQTIVVEPYISSEHAGSTYHTVAPGEYDVSAAIGLSPNSIVGPMSDTSRPQGWLFQTLLGLNFFQSIYIESELLGKINGSRGCFYSKYSRVGVSWRSIRSGSPTYYVSYYSHQPPPDEKIYGRWRRLEHHGMWQGPTFKVNISNQSFATVLPYRFFTQIFSMLAYTRPNERPTVIRNCLKILPMLQGSSWQTTVICGDQRFFTLCTLANSGDPKKMIKSVIDKIGDRPLTSADVTYLMLVRDFFMRNEYGRRTTTPLLGLPIRFMALEKDLPLMMMWHIRGKEHDTRCLTKLLKSATDELENRFEYVDFLERQADFLDKALNVGTDQDEFDSIFDNAPDFPCYNHLLFMCASHRASAALKDLAASRGFGTKMSITTLLTDHNAQELSPPRQLLPNTVMSPIKVHTGMVGMMRHYEQPGSMYTLLSRQARGPKIDFVFGMHAKDSKSSDREIAQMHIDMRPQQAFSEAGCATYCEAEECDMMLNHEKPALFVNRFADVIRQRGTVTSEDKQFFCGHLLPECMSLSTHVVAADVGSTMLVTSAALQRIDTVRWIVLPIDADPNCVSERLETKNLVRVEGKHRAQVKAVKLHMHMQQGIRALGAAVHATTYSKGIQLIMGEMSPEFGETRIMTTSDDAVRGRIPPDNAKLERQSTDIEFVYRPLSLMRQAMMVNSDRKLMVIRALAEFNNMVVNMHGMIPQQFVHAHLCIQPLLGQSLAADLVTAVSTARSSLMWGDSIDVATAAYECYMVLIKQKWLLTDQEHDLLCGVGLIPQSDEELVAGFAYRSKQLVSAIWSLFDDEARADILAGHVPFARMITSYSLARGQTDRKKKISKIRALPKLNSPHYRLNRTSKTIIASRIHQQGGAQKYLRQVEPRKRIGAKDTMMDAILAPARQIDDELYEKLIPIVGAPEVIIEPRKCRQEHMMPQHQGGGANSVFEEDVDVVLALREASINLQRIPTEAEVAAAELSTELLDEWFTRRERSGEHARMGFKSASGLPRFMFHNGKVLAHPRTFSYTIHREHEDVVRTEFTHGLVSYKNFEPILPGGAFIKLARTRKAVLPFGVAKTDEGWNYFYRETGMSTSRIFLAKPSGQYKIHDTGNTRVLLPIAKDRTPIDPIDFVGEKFEPPTFVAGMCGDIIALLNYGDYLNTRSKQAMAYMSQIYSKLGCERPHDIMYYLPTYPTFSEDAVVMPRGRTTLFVGRRSIRKLRLYTTEGELENMRTIDLNGVTPVLVENPDVVEEDEIELE